MADDRPDLSIDESAPNDRDEQPDATPAEEDAWLAENLEWVRTKVQEALDDPRPTLNSEEVRASLEAHSRELFAKYGR